MDEKTNGKGRLRSLVTLICAVMIASVALLGSGAVSFNAVAASSTTDIDIELVPRYREVTYTLDPIETLQRRDAQGDWNLISTPVIDDSLLVCEQNEGANLTVTDWPHIDDGLYYEVRLKANATTSTNTAKTSRLISTDGRTHRELPLPSPCALLKGMYGSPLSPIRQAKRASSS